MSKKSDFSQLSALANRINTAVYYKDYENSTYSNQKILKAGAYKQMDHLLDETPKGTDGSNWYNWNYPPGGGDLGGPHSASYFLPGGAHKAGTLARGWVMDMPEFGASRKPGKELGHKKVDTTPIDHVQDGLSMTFWNTAPYAWAVERGHAIRYPYFWYDNVLPRQGPIVGYVPGQWYVSRAVTHAEKDVKKAIGNEAVRQLRKVVKKK